METVRQTLGKMGITENHQPTEKKTQSSEYCHKHALSFTSYFRFGVWSCCPQCAKEDMERIAREDIKQATVSSNIPWLSKRRAGMSLETYRPRTTDQEKILTRVNRYVENFKQVLEFGSCLCLVGPPGTGKTHLATGIGVEVVGMGYSVHYERLYDLTRRIKATYSGKSTDSEESIIKAMAGYDLLILDEVGLKNMSETEITLTYEIIDVRYEAVKPTIIVSNLCEKGLEENLGQRTIDRLYENHGVFLVFNGESVRRL